MCVTDAQSRIVDRRDGLLSASLLCASASAGESLRVVVLMDAYSEQGLLLDQVRGMNRRDRRTHVALSWQSPPTDAGHDPATLYRIDRSTVANGTFAESGSSTTSDWHDIDATTEPKIFYYLVRAENAGGSE